MNAIYNIFRDQVDQIIEKYGAYTVSEEYKKESPILPKEVIVTHKFLNGGKFKSKYIQQSMSPIGFETKMPFSNDVRPQTKEFRKIQKEFADLTKRTIKKYK